VELSCRWVNHPAVYIKDRFFFLLLDLHYIQKEELLWSLSVSSDFESFNEVNLYKATFISFHKVQCSYNQCILSSSLVCYLYISVTGVKRMYQFLFHLAVAGT
jgi:hypothetical protein